MLQDDEKIGDDRVISGAHQCADDQRSTTSAYGQTRDGPIIGGLMMNDDLLKKADRCPKVTDKEETSVPTNYNVMSIPIHSKRMGTAEHRLFIALKS